MTEHKTQNIYELDLLQEGAMERHWDRDISDIRKILNENSKKRSTSPTIIFMLRTFVPCPAFAGHSAYAES
jgi:hypothetical protein